MRNQFLKLPFLLNDGEISVYEIQSSGSRADQVDLRSDSDVTLHAKRILVNY